MLHPSAATETHPVSETPTGCLDTRFSCSSARAPRPPTPNTIMDMASLADLEARVAALEADRADYRAVLAAVGALAGRVSDAEVKIDAQFG